MIPPPDIIVRKVREARLGLRIDEHVRRYRMYLKSGLLGKAEEELQDADNLAWQISRWDEGWHNL
ncbi:hypothetical protein A2635_05260 [Candidatus Peribacteria bacterium RIFCSPHIGHO2_01_FULL_51_9]|nr:MAG: hypothetical protein A2635_05260 [Candidatus Peribacteria bacterium RIFCSPHIGHO2_01_FULL_51_9]